jgi:SpoVK/Ycf46/Vps4 family AAA+-type ATPase
VGGAEAAIKDIKKLVFHMEHPEVFEQLGVPPPRGFLLHGPPGSGKTLLGQWMPFCSNTWRVSMAVVCPGFQHGSRSNFLVRFIRDNIES